MGIGLVNEFTDHSYTRLETTSSYSAIANLRNSQIATAPATPFFSLLFNLSYRYVIRRPHIMIHNPKLCAQSPQQFYFLGLHT
jgi:hypothetical protein